MKNHDACSSSILKLNNLKVNNNLGILTVTDFRKSF